MIKSLSLSILLFITFFSFAQSILHERKYRVGDQITISLEMFDVNTQNLIKSGNYISKIDGIQFSTIVDVSNITFKLPNANKIIGDDKIISIDSIGGKNFSQIKKIAIHGEEPVIQSLDQTVLFKDIPGVEQLLSFSVNNPAYIDRISVIGLDNNTTKNGSVIFTTNTSELSAEQLRINEGERKIALSMYIREKNLTSLKLKFSYRNMSGNIQEIEVPLPQIKLNDKHSISYSTFLISSLDNQKLFEDDFNTTRPTILKFDLSNVSAGSYRFEPSEYFDVSYNGNGVLEVKQGESLFHVKVTPKKVLPPTSYVIQLNSIQRDSRDRPNNHLIGEFRVFPTPKIRTMKVGLNEGIYQTITKANSAVYSLALLGENLASVDEIRSDLVLRLLDENGSVAAELSPSNRWVVNEIIIDIKFSDHPSLGIGQFSLVLVRKKDQREYPLKGLSLVINYPRLIFSNQTSSFELFGKTEISRSGRFDKDQLLTEDSPIILKINKVSNINGYGPQYLTVTATYIKNNGITTKASWTSKGTSYLTVTQNDLYWDLRDEFKIDKFNFNDKIKVLVKHSAEMYENHAISIPHQITYHNYKPFFNRIGLSFSLPPFLVAVRNVRRKIINSDSTSYDYIGKSKTEFQPLVLNAGLGLKVRFKDMNYEDNNLGVGLYFMGMDFSNSDSREEQINEKENHNFVERGSFNLLALFEWAPLHLDNPNLNIPIYLGCIFIPDPVDNGPRLAFTFGLGVDIRIIGKK